MGVSPLWADQISFLQVHRIIIIGAGVIGCAIAEEFSARGARVTLIEDRRVGGGATQASAGILAPYIEGHDAGPLRDLGIRSLALYDEWIARVRAASGAELEYYRDGTLEIALDPPHAEELRRAAAQLADIGARWLDPADARASEPALGTVAGALLVPVHGAVAARQLTEALSLAARRHGAALYYSRATRISVDGGTLRVATPDRIFEAETVILAAGSWSGSIDIDGDTVPPVRPVRGQLLDLDWRGRQPVSRVLWGPECYVVPRRDGSLLVGATVEDVGFDERATAAGVRDLLDAACELLPEGWGAAFAGVRVGLRPATPDELPAIGPGRLPGLIHACGHYRNGVLLAPLTARLVADVVLDGRRDPILDRLAPTRFGQG